jgi:hypothetical protein
MEKRKRPQKVKLANVVEGIQGTPRLDTIEESSTEERATQENEDRDPTLLDDIIDLIFLELPILSVILIVALILGHFLAGWSAVQRSVPKMVLLSLYLRRCFVKQEHISPPPSCARLVVFIGV